MADAAGVNSTLDPALRQFIAITAIDDGWRFADALFQRKYAHPAPRYPHHLGLFYRDAHGRYELAHFLHFFPVREMALIGGACTDGDVVRRMSEAERAAVDASGGLMLQATRYGLAKFGATCDAIFGHCGDARSFGVLMRAGFQPVDHPHLVVYWPRLLPEQRRQQLISEADALGAF